MGLKVYVEYLTGLLFGDRTNLQINFVDAMFREDWKTIIPDDKNREDDGLEFRRVCGEDTLIDVGEKPVSFLEVVIGISIRLSFFDDFDKNWVFWFWVLMNNLNPEFESSMELQNRHFEELDIAMARVINRTFRPDGYGGLFPLTGFYEDQRDVDIWYQMHRWIEQHGI